MKLLRTIQLDPSDRFVFEKAAAPGEWAVPGGFMFFGHDTGALQGKERQAFRSGFLGLGSFGWSTLAVVQEASEAEREQAVQALAAHLLAQHGAPDQASAEIAAREEIAFAASLCEHPVNTTIALLRRAENGEIRETFRTLSMSAEEAGKDFSGGGFRVFSFVEEEGPEEHVDVAGLAGAGKPQA